MRFVYDLVVPANTAAKSPQRTDVQLFKGTLTNVGIWFQAGPHNQVHVVVLDRILQIIPSAVGTSIIGNDVIYRIPMDYKFEDDEVVVSLLGWSPDTVYPHTITIFFEIDPADLSEKTDIERLLKAIVPQGR